MDMNIRHLVVCVASLVLAAIIFMNGAVAAEEPSAKPEDFRPAAVSDLPGVAQSKVVAFIKGFLNSTRSMANRDAGDLGWDCLAAAALLEAGDKRAGAKLRATAQLLADTAVRSKGVIKGWRYQGKSPDSCPHGGLDAFGDGTCNTPNTVYSFQTGLGIACLATAGDFLGNKEFLTMAGQVLSFWQQYTLAAVPCTGCAYYLYSDHSNDSGRYVRNINVFMAYGAAVLGIAASDPAATQLARRAMRSELDERRAGNEGYLGRLDPQWISKQADASQNVENHAAAMAVLSDQIGVLLASKEFRDHGLGVWEKWATCDNKRCRTANCRFWGGDASKCQATLTAAHCAFRKKSPLASSQCGEYLSRASSLPPFGLWATIVGGTSQ
ncbi:MAG: hypothetical protein ABTR92_04740 [Candidatus Accumulibacter phosphatis]|uniref:hypothetical protein n=1 Tax=Candidatus Accumulibacter sp. ACC012 TaxID=2823332 RepID=UPI0025C01F4C|nr:hypothetical protein [Candidatus Accumulibacter sp. ACC012]